MPSTSYFFPRAKQGTALGLQSGIGNFGVIEWTSAIAAYGPFGFGMMLSCTAPALFFGLGVGFALLAAVIA